jgi:hypothetical protein
VKRLLPALIVALILLAGGLAAAEATDQQTLAMLEQEPARDKSIRRALSFLRALQRPDGSVGDDNRTANTSLALMAHLAAGSTPDDLQHGPWIRRSLAYVLSMQDGNGYFGAKDGSRMYGHGIATLMLAEALGMCRDEELDERIRAAVERAVAVTVNAAKVPKTAGHEGGWRYQPHDGVSDMSLSGWQLMSLHATQQVGIAVPAEVISDAVAYAKRMTSAEGMVGYDHVGDDHAALRGMALIALAIGDQLDAPEAGRIADRVLKDPVAWRGPWLFYRVYYDSVGLSRAAPLLWAGYAATLESVLIDHQGADGSWPAPPGDNEAGFGVTYRTALAVLALGVNKHVLPAYQR